MFAFAGADSAFANGLAIPGGPTVLDGSFTIGADSANPPDATTAEATFLTTLEPGRSYACTVLGNDFLSTLDIISVVDPSANAVSFSSIGSVTPAVLDGTPANNRISVKPSGTGTQTAGVYQVGVNNSTVALFGSPPPTQAVPARFDCVETTLYGGFNTNVNDFNFLELINITNTAISGNITATNTDGTVVINNQAFTVQPNRRSDIDIHTPAGPLKYGLIKVTHNAPLGGLQALVSQYDGNISNFVLTASIPMNTRAK